MKRRVLVLGTLALLFGGLGQARADFVFTGSTSNMGGNFSAEVDFSQAGNVLTVTLKNLDATIYGNTPNDHLAPGQVLTGVFFTIKGVATLANPSSAAGVLLNNSGKNVIADGWGYSPSTLSGGNTPGGQLGIFSSGYSSQGKNNFQGATGSFMLDGYGFGIVGSGYAAGNRIGGDSPGQVVVQDTASFTVTLPSSTALTLSDFSDVSFQYGTSLSEQNVPGSPPGPAVPAPASLALVGSAAVCMMLGYAWRQRKLAAA
jgi:hypothetical protein